MEKLNINEKLALTVEEAGALLGLSRPTMYQLIHVEGFPKLRVGRLKGNKELLPQRAA